MMHSLQETHMMQAYQIAANIVTRFGDSYLPIFERLHKEIEIQKSKLDYKSIAHDIAQRSITRDS